MQMLLIGRTMHIKIGSTRRLCVRSIDHPGQAQSLIAFSIAHHRAVGKESLQSIDAVFQHAGPTQIETLEFIAPAEEQ